MDDIDAILNGDETILWEGRPALLPFFANAIVSFFLGVLFLAIVGHFVVGQPWTWHTDLAAAAIFLSSFLLVGFLLAAAFPLYRILAYLRLSYAITSRGTSQNQTSNVSYQVIHHNGQSDILRGRYQRATQVQSPRERQLETRRWQHLCGASYYGLAVDDCP